VRDVTLPERDVITQEEKAFLSRLGGWQEEGRKTGEGFWAWIGRLLGTHLFGWIITVLATSLGAPFWFDMLNRFVNIRNAGRAPDEPADKSRRNAPAVATTGGQG
jgi:hypothetical protein